MGIDLHGEENLPDETAGEMADHLRHMALLLQLMACRHQAMAILRQDTHHQLSDHHQSMVHRRQFMVHHQATDLHLELLQIHATRHMDPHKVLLQHTVRPLQHMVRLQVIHRRATMEQHGGVVNHRQQASQLRRQPIGSSSLILLVANHIITIA